MVVETLSKGFACLSVGFLLGSMFENWLKGKNGVTGFPSLKDLSDKMEEAAKKSKEESETKEWLEMPHPDPDEEHYLKNQKAINNLNVEERQNLLKKREWIRK